MIYLQRVKSSLKNGVDVQLGPRTVLVGANGAGKTAIIQACELATGGHVSDMEGRDRVKNSQALARLFPPDVRLYAQVVLSDGTPFVWEMKPGAEPGSFKQPELVAPLTVRWPLQELSATLGGEQGTVKAWLEAQVIGSLAVEDVLGALPVALHPVVKSLMRTSGQSDFLSLAKAAKDEAKSLRSNATRKEKTIEQMTQGIPTPLLASERERLEKELSGLGDVAMISREDYDALLAGAGELAARYATCMNQIGALPEDDPEIARAIRGLYVANDLILEHRANFGPEAECKVCGSALTVAAQAARIEAALSTSLKPFSDLLETRIRLEKEAKLLHTAIASATEKLRDAVVGSSKERVSELNRLLALDTSARKAWENDQAARIEVNTARKRATALVEVGEALEATGEALLSRRKSEFEERVSTFLPTGDVLGVDLDSARVGLLRGGNLHSALSGAEWSRVLLALAAATVGGGSTPCVLVPADRSWDRDTLTSVMAALSGSSAQIILMSTVMPDPVEGWSLVEL
jgi:hypothetical protein